MFTGLVTAIGTVRRCSKQHNGLELTIGSSYSDLEPGESIAVDGACLTVRNLENHTFTVQIVGPSLARTRFEHYSVGQRVNLERALRVGDRLGGHLVQGHVDGIGTVERLDVRSDARLLDLHVPAEVGRVSVPLGSITVDGVSLTVNAKPTPSIIQISLIPFTLEHTTLGDRGVGDQVHLEADMIGKYVRALMEEKRE
ncbi:MAG TPA: riboflavin synthase [Gemmatimonadales bacterium]|nr:riboflavin synthase [Gemmatimonadales bacterium]